MATESTNTTSSEASVDKIDAIANLLMDEEDTADVTDDAEDTEDTEDGEPEESTQDGQEEESESAEGDEEVTWAGVLGLDESKVVTDEDGNLVGINVKVDGEVSTVKMDDLIAGYQNNRFNTQKSQKLSEERKMFESFRDNAVQDYQSRVATVDKLAQYMQHNLVKDFNSIDWNRLRAENPAEYAATYQDFQAKNEEIQQIMQAIEVEKHQMSQQLFMATQQQKQELLHKSIESLIDNNPSWTNKEVAVKAFQEMSSFALDRYGIAPEEFNQILDARAISVLQDAMKYHKGLDTAKQKTSKPVPKFQKSNSRPAVKKVSKLEKLTRAASKAKGHTKRDLQAAAIAELI